MSQDQNIVILERLDSLQKSVDRIDKDLSSDREDLQEFRVRLGAMEGEFNELRKGLKTQSDKIQDKMADVIEPLMDQIEDRKIVEYKAISFFSKFKFWGKRR